MLQYVSMTRDLVTSLMLVTYVGLHIKVRKEMEIHTKWKNGQGGHVKSGAGNPVELEITIIVKTMEYVTFVNMW